ncbi:hypothetical protein L6164_002156 [Bauhinia variegata]|uniref:Uncharacterized protein n=1 Tax=Bauhinia variegata TaxID=167791 RepID=A0ACB9PXV7_BAUVA|nr:hypothetical protein L6164_002156 [Bauhinia variegata]
MGVFVWHWKRQLGKLGNSDYEAQDKDELEANGQLGSLRFDIETAALESSINIGGDDNEKMKMSICLTWKNLWVTVSRVKNGSRPILQDLIGYARETLAYNGSFWLWQVYSS